MSSQPCIICNGADAKCCSSCHSIWYCSQKCQKDDWPLHKKICKAFAALPSRPSSLHRLALLFPVDSKDPQLIWVECKRRVEEDIGITWESAETQHLLGVEKTNPEYGDMKEYKRITRSKRREFNLSYTVQVIVREAGLVDGSSPNVCVRHTTKGQMTHNWSGPIVVMRQPGTAVDPLIYEDIRASEYRVAVDYFLSY